MLAGSLIVLLAGLRYLSYHRKAERNWLSRNVDEDKLNKIKCKWSNEDASDGSLLMTKDSKLALKFQNSKDVKISLRNLIETFFALKKS